MMKVSIIIPVYKVEKEIGRCLASVIVQTWANLEVILVDDASPDSSMAIAKKVIDESTRKDIFRIVTHDNNAGLSAARNTGMANAQGDYIFFLDSDDALYDENSIAVLAKNAVDTGADVVFGNYDRIWPDTTLTSIYNKKAVLSAEALIRAYCNGEVPIMAWNQLLSRRFLSETKLQFKVGILNEDNLFSYQLLFQNPIVSLTGITTYKNYVRAGSIMNTFTLNRLVSPIIVYEETVKSYKNAKTKSPLWLVSFDHFAFKRYVDIIRSGADEKIKRNLYHRLRSAQCNVKGVGKMRYVFNSHIYLPERLGYEMMKIITKRYVKTRRLQ